MLTGPDGLIGVYRKTHLFYEEKLWFSSGDTGFKVWQTPIGNIGVMICFDWFFPESARTLALRGADIIAHPSNLILPHCPDAMVTRCIENRVFAVTANRTGSEQRGDKEKLMFIGKSQITSPMGEILYRASGDKEELTVMEIAVERARDKNLNSMNNLFIDRKKNFMNKRISVIIPNYNGSSTIGRCLEAALSSEYDNFEVIVTDDCSTDNSVEIIKNFRVNLFP